MPVGFKNETIAEGINAGTALAATVDGRIYYAEQTGHIRIVEDGIVLETPLLDLSARVNTHWERGLVGLQFDPQYPKQPYLFVVYIANDPYVHHVISRFTIVDGVADVSSEKILLEGDDQSTLGGSQQGGHQGGPIRFGPEGMLYISIGEQTEELASQSLDTLQGKILRINPDGSIPRDNPFYAQTSGKYRSIYALGIRNPFGLAFQPGTGRLFEADIGKSSFDEINEIQPGKNYGWPLAEGMSDNPEFTNPIHAYPPAIGRSICGSVFYPESGNFPEPWKGKLFFADWASHWLKAIDVDNAEVALDFGTDFVNPVAVEVAPDGSLWVLNRATRWRDQKKFANNSGSLTRISYVGEGYRESESVEFPQTLVADGVIRRGIPFIPSEGFIEVQTNSPVWRGSFAENTWMRLPEGEKIEYSQEGDWNFPEGAMLLHHFMYMWGSPIETHLYQANGDGTFRASAYRWENVFAGTVENPDVAIVERSEFLPLVNDKDTMWLSPGPVAKLDPKTAIFGFQPQFTTRQLNRDGQIEKWNSNGWFKNRLSQSELEVLPKLDHLQDESVLVVDRIRSYLDSNCASCHKPGGPARGFFDARILTAFEDQKLMSGELMAGDLGIEGAKLVVPGDPEKSILYQRLARKDGFRMPPGSINAHDSPVLPLLEKWIRELGKAKSE